jgi:tetratricopeptide (TPR) repeat protein
MSKTRAIILASVLGLLLLIGCDRTEVRRIPAPEIASLATKDSARLAGARAELERSPKSAEAWGRYGMFLQAFDFDAEALDCYWRARELDSSDPRWPYFISSLIAPDDPAASLALLRATVDRCGNEPEAPRYYLAKALAESGEWREAETHAVALLNAKPDFTPARLLQAQSASARGDLESVQRLAEACVADARTAKAAWVLLASILARQENLLAAKQAAAQAAALPLDQVVYDAFQAEVAALRGDPHQLASRAHSLLAARQLVEAAAVIERLTREHPDFAEGWLVLGRLRLLQKDLPSAETVLQKHLQLEPKSVQGLFQLGMVQLNGGRFDLAAETFKAATELKSDFGPAWYNRGFALGRAGRLEESAKAFREAIRYHPEHLDSYILLADLELQSGRNEEALGLIRRAESISPSDARLPVLRRKVAARAPRR